MLFLRPCFESRQPSIASKILTASRYGPPGKIRYTFSLVDWAQRPEVQAAWAQIAKQHGITADPFKDLERIWSPTHLALVTPWAMSVRYVFEGLSALHALYYVWLTHGNAQDGQSTEDGLARVCGHIRGCDENI